MVINKDTELLERQYKDRMRDRELNSAKKLRATMNPEDFDGAEFDFTLPAGTAAELNTFMINQRTSLRKLDAGNGNDVLGSLHELDDEDLRD